MPMSSPQMTRMFGLSPSLTTAPPARTLGTPILCLASSIGEVGVTRPHPPGVIRLTGRCRRATPPRWGRSHGRGARAGPEQLDGHRPGGHLDGGLLHGRAVGEPLVDGGAVVEAPADDADPAVLGEAGDAVAGGPLGVAGA